MESQASLKIWCNATLPPECEDVLRRRAPGDEIYFARGAADQNSAAPNEAELIASDVAFGQPPPEAIFASRSLRWIHLSSAGYTAYDRADLRDHLRASRIALTNSSAVYNEPCAQHLLAMITGLARQLPAAHDEQRGARKWPMQAIRAESRLLNEQTLLILGYGAIGRRLTELLRPLNMKIYGFRRQARGDETIPIAAGPEVNQYLAVADHVVNILPASDHTVNFLDAERLSLLKPGAILYNIGRGTTVEQEALIEALTSGRLAAAYLDVTVPEPLPPEHPLWRTPNCHITPHTAGGHANEFARLVEHFLANLVRFREARLLLDRVF